jgi:hypothetical protein
VIYYLFIILFLAAVGLWTFIAIKEEREDRKNEPQNDEE